MATFLSYYEELKNWDPRSTTDATWQDRDLLMLRKHNEDKVFSFVFNQNQENELINRENELEIIDISYEAFEKSLDVYNLPKRLKDRIIATRNPNTKTDWNFYNKWGFSILDLLITSVGYLHPKIRDILIKCIFNYCTPFCTPPSLNYLYTYCKPICNNLSLRYLYSYRDKWLTTLVLNRCRINSFYTVKDVCGILRSIVDDDDEDYLSLLLGIRFLLDTFPYVAILNKKRDLYRTTIHQYALTNNKPKCLKLLKNGPLLLINMLSTRAKQANPSLPYIPLNKDVARIIVHYLYAPYFNSLKIL